VSILVVDVGTSGLRAAIVRPDATVSHTHYRSTPPATPAPGLVEFDAKAMAEKVLDVARAALDAGGPVDAVGVANQRASTIVWDRVSGEPIGPGVGWQDLRTVFDCLTLAGSGIRLAPNQSATKIVWLLNTFDSLRARDLCFGTVDSWVVWTLSGGAHHVIDATNAALTGLLGADHTSWDADRLATLGIPASIMPEIVDSTGLIGAATALPGAPPITGVGGDQQASLIGQGCVRPGDAKITFGTGGMLDVCVGDEAPAFAHRGAAGTFPIVAWRAGGATTWGVEAVMLSAGANVDWLCDDL
jgi:glycerol kinase